MITPTAAARDELAPSGSLRAALNLGNGVLVQADAATGEAKGLAVDLAHELARRLAIPLEPVRYKSAGDVFEALQRDEWDIAFLAIDPVRAAVIDFTAPHVLIEGNFVVRDESPLRTIADIDRSGVRISLAQGSGYDLFLTRTMKQATLVRSRSPEGAMNAFMADKLDSLASVKQSLLEFMKIQPGLRMIEPRFMSIEHAMATPKGRPAGAAYLKAFVEDMKASGFVAGALQRSDQHDAVIAPACAENVAR